MEQNLLVPDYILKKLILLYGFTKEIQAKIKAQLNPLSNITYENYFIINGEWLNKYKEFYNYDQIVGLIEKYKFNFSDYFSFKSNINTILNAIKSFGIAQKEKEFPIELKSGISFSPSVQSFINNLYIHDNFYIVNSELNGMISQDKDNPIKPNYPAFVNKTNLNGFLNKYSYFIYLKNIEICTINKDGMFVNQYCIKLGEGDPTIEIGNIIKSGGIDKVIVKRALNNKNSAQYNEHGGLIFNIEKIRKDKEKEPKDNQEKKGSISNSIINIEKKKNINANKKSNMRPFSYVVPNTSKLNQNPEDSVPQMSETLRVIQNAQNQNQSKGNSVVLQNNNNIKQNQILGNINNNNYQNINNQIIQQNNFYPQQNNYDQMPYQFQNNMNMNVNNFLRILKINQNNNNSSQYKISNNINESIIDELKNEKIKNKLLEEKYNKLNLLFEQKIKAMENELTNEKNKNLLIEEKYKSIQIKSEKKIKSLEKILNEEKNKNQLLENKLKELKKYKEIFNINQSNNGNLDLNESITKALLDKDKEINELKNKLSRYPFELKEGEKMMTVNFLSSDKKIQNYSIICKNTDVFYNFEKRLYDEYKAFFKKNNIFTVNGLKINKLKSLEENKIKNNDVIVLNV